MTIDRHRTVHSLAFRESGDVNVDAKKLDHHGNPTPGAVRGRAPTATFPYPAPARESSSMHLGS